MRLAFVGIDPGTDKDGCPAEFIDEETGDFVFQGWTVRELSEDPALIKLCLSAFEGVWARGIDHADYQIT